MENGKGDTVKRETWRDLEGDSNSLPMCVMQSKAAAEGGKKKSPDKWFGVFATSLQLTHLLCPPVVVPAVLKLFFWVRSSEDTSVSYSFFTVAAISAFLEKICRNVRRYDSVAPDIGHATLGHQQSGLVIRDDLS